MVSSWVIGLSSLFNNLQGSLAEAQCDIRNLDDFHMEMGRKTLSLEQLRDQWSTSGDKLKKWAQDLHIPKNQLVTHGSYSITLVIFLMLIIAISFITWELGKRVLVRLDRNQQGVVEAQDEQATLAEREALPLELMEPPIIWSRAPSRAE